jgi:hypothetical protein
LKAKTLICLIAFSLTTLVAQERTSGAWIENHLKWRKAPKEINPRLRDARAIILYFGKNHVFKMLYVTVNNEPGRYTVICNGCGNSSFLGSWQETKSTFTVKYRVVERTVIRIGEEIRGPLITEDGKMTRSSITFHGHTFHRSPELDSDVQRFFPDARPQ